jgi:hypothetical protein
MGSAAAEREDSWSDIDLAFGIGNGGELSSVLAEWTGRMYNEHSAVHHVDVPAGAWLYRVFILASTLQVDLAFVSANEFRAFGPTFKVVFGNANEPRNLPQPKIEDLVGLAWLHALHARSSIARRKLWQAEYMLSGLRNHALALACVRHGLPAVHGRGIDMLPSSVTSEFENSLVRHLDVAELSRAFQAVIDGLVREIQSADEQLARRLCNTLKELSDCTS